MRKACIVSLSDSYIFFHICLFTFFYKVACLFYTQCIEEKQIPYIHIINYYLTALAYSTEMLFESGKPPIDCRTLQYFLLKLIRTHANS